MPLFTNPETGRPTFNLDTLIGGNRRTTQAGIDVNPPDADMLTHGYRFQQTPCLHGFPLRDRDRPSRV